MPIQNDSYDGFLASLIAQAPQPVPPTSPGMGAALGMRAAMTGVDTRREPSPAPLKKPAYAAGTADVQPTPDLPFLQRLGLGVRNAVGTIGQAQVAQDQAMAAPGVAIGEAVGSGVRDLAAGLGGNAQPVLPSPDGAPAATVRSNAGVTVAPPAVTPVDNVARTAAPVVPQLSNAALLSKYGMVADTHETGETHPTTHTLDDFVKANAHMTPRDWMAIGAPPTRLTPADIAKHDLLALQDQAYDAERVGHIQAYEKRVAGLDPNNATHAKTITEAQAGLRNAITQALHNKVTGRMQVTAPAPYASNDALDVLMRSQQGK